MNSNYPSLPLACENHGLSSIFLPSRAPGDVVEPPLVTSAGNHTHQRVERVSDDDDDDDDGYDSSADFSPRHDHAAGQYDSDENDDAAHAPQHSGDHDDDARSRRRAERQSLRHDDKFDREVDRTRTQQERFERSARRSAQYGASGRRRTARGPRGVDDHDQRPRARGPLLRRRQPRDNSARSSLEPPELPTRDHFNGSRGVAHVATYSDSVKRFASGPLHGTALALYFVLLPYVVVTKWALASYEVHGALIRGLLVCLALFWLAFLAQLGRNVVRLRKGIGISTSGSAWLAGLVVALLSFVLPGFSHLTPPTARSDQASIARTYDSPATTAPPRQPSPSAVVEHVQAAPDRSVTPPSSPQPRTPVPLLGALPMALMAKRRHDQLRQHQFECPDDQVDGVIELLRSYDPYLIARLRFLIGSERSGVVHVPGALESGELSSDTDPLVGCLLAHDDDSVLSFSREGGQLSIDARWTVDETRESIIALHDGRITFVDNETDLLRALATRALHAATVVYLGPARDLDDELRASCVTLVPAAISGAVDGVDSSGAPMKYHRQPSGTRPDVRVELLRASPAITGLDEPFVATLRRRCLEMVAYLALHRGEPITGERLRSRVLGYADVEASSRTLANTASAVRRSLGVNGQGPLLHPVSSSGLYETHGVTSDVEIFHALVVRARALAVPAASVLAHEALQLVHGEPLASALRGFEWFLAEGHFAQLQRDGEYAALLLHHQSTSQGDYELAFWALQQGLLIDPYSDALIEAIARVPRLRQFGGDRTRRAQDESVGAGGAVAVGWSFNRLGNQIS